jgi:glycerol-3-phosphate dehydrogenase (NAD(P)+)
MKIGFLGAGSWGFCLTALLAGKGYEVLSWTTKAALAQELNESRMHPLFPNYRLPGKVSFTADLEFLLRADRDVLVESVTAAGIRPVFEKIRSIARPRCPIILSSKGIEQESGLILAEVILEALGKDFMHPIGFISGPSFASEVIAGLPTSVVGTGLSAQAIDIVCESFNTRAFRVYPNADYRGVAYGGALKNVIAIACGIAEGLALGASARAALITRGLHEVRKLAMAHGCQQETLNGLSGMGDFVLTCNSMLSRNFKYGYLLAKGLSPQEAEKQIGMVVEGAYTAPSALKLGAQSGVALPIMEQVSAIINGELLPRDAVYALMQRTIKEESL